ncbi:MAG: hypothetical protein A2487_12705 [Candidatus Raymondbacteria bacterium RifOxyC12_full_50_8]|uniref:Uncharacterized protein n=1 Tax=Candidatus Raymondbacteria bacterium RIFOXYD12_FULL_49_13 TaxID=1817890 RepID=A0A1F7FCP1_UNCRA|nr:MAG: hypothetical protein A2248_03055 [Candidatus Raymondbacteria bacterium RIFOXYA2_FULL_49_16]OGJ93458.1 MAG: hypothetical protein A2350_18975 [Candidatus Raymondbacteria bacterium RifOxyB12_full_50_8]OGK04282.1 MAG: hypothetical protein A2519_18150 [Candidatus Raymondbacteria bacterium RIFOXYD12_FULL_49_13]OGK07978.1 MAG: hypothetical protein A2487_12705 [Candidatus Raymondbacteria bacterium RifOxyC12_full_50_8]OGP42434.1 MAG: hypothetical protein A2324_17090 [Candidatus Raymondbacteria b
MWLYAFIVVFLIVLVIFLSNIAIQFLRLERSIEKTVEVLEAEITDVFGSHSVKKEGEAAMGGDKKPNAEKPLTSPAK